MFMMLNGHRKQAFFLNKEEILPTYSGKSCCLYRQLQLRCRRDRNLVQGQVSGHSCASLYRPHTCGKMVPYIVQAGQWAKTNKDLF